MLGVIGYEERGDMIDSVFQLNLGTTTLATFTIEVMCAGTSAVYMFRISYISLEDVNNAFYCFWIPYTNLVISMLCRPLSAQGPARAPRPRPGTASTPYPWANNLTLICL